MIAILKPIIKLCITVIIQIF